MVAKQTHTFSLDLSSTFNQATKLALHTIAFEPLETNILMNQRVPTEDWVRESPPVIPERALVNCFLPQGFKMKILLWNCRGVANPNFRRALRDLMA